MRSEMIPAEVESDRHIAVKFGLPVLYIVVVALLAYRMTVGVDLTDESYYVTFLDGWLKDGLGHGENLVVHQTAALTSGRTGLYDHAAEIGARRPPAIGSATERNCC